MKEEAINTYIKMLLVTAFSLCVATKVDILFGGILSAVAWLALLALCIPLTYLTVRMRHSQYRSCGPWIDPDWFWALMCYGGIIPLVLGFYLSFNYPGWVQYAASFLLLPIAGLSIVCDKLLDENGKFTITSQHIRSLTTLGVVLWPWVAVKAKHLYGEDVGMLTGLFVCIGTPFLGHYVAIQMDGKEVEK